jgi:CRISPR-associated protein Cmr4
MDHHRGALTTRETLMKSSTDLIFFHTITPLHVGCGQDVGVVDLPVIRERTTGYPYIPGSGIRGSLRDRFEGDGDEKRKELTDLYFGPGADAELETDERYASCLSVFDAKLLLFPVRSDQGPYLWLTCPFVLSRFNRDCKALQPGMDAALAPPDVVDPGAEEIVGPQELGKRVHLEELAYSRDEAPTDDAAGKLATWAGEVGKKSAVAEIADRTVLVSNKSFAYFVRHATILTQHNQLTSAKTVKGGALFSVEAVPPEALFYGFLRAVPPRNEKQEKAETPEQVLDGVWSGLGADAPYLTLGGHESTGLGITHVVRAKAAPAAKGGGS